jgi:hypothetical protein
MFAWLKRLLPAPRVERNFTPPSPAGLEEIERSLEHIAATLDTFTDPQLTFAFQECEQRAWQLATRVSAAGIARPDDGDSGVSAAKLTELVGLIEKLGTAAHRRAQTQAQLLSPMVVSLGLVANGSARASGERVLSALQEQDTDDLLQAVRVMRLWPKEYCDDRQQRLRDEVKKLRERKERIEGFRRNYDDIRDAEITAENIDGACEILRGVLAGSGASPKKRSRERHIAKALERIAAEFDRRADFGTMLLDMAGYARQLVDFLSTHRTKALGVIGASIVVPATIIKQVLASIAVDQDLSAADTVDKFDPTDTFKFLLVTITFGTGVAAVLLTFWRARVRAERVIAAAAADRSVARSSGLGRMLASATLACTFSASACCLVAYGYWSGNSSIPGSSFLRKAGAHEADRLAMPDARQNALPGEAIGFVPVTTFGNLRVFRCVLAKCAIGTSSVNLGGTMVVRSDRVPLEVNRAKPPGEMLSNDSPATVLIDSPNPASYGALSDSMRAQVHVDGALSIVPGLEFPKTIALDAQSAGVLAGAIRAIRWQLPASPNRVEIPPAFQATLDEIASALQAQTTSLSRLIEVQDRVVSTQSGVNDHAGKLVEITRAVANCAERRRERNGAQRVLKGVWGEDPCPVP